MNFNQDAKVVRLNSPRSVEACKRLGIIASELSRRTYQDVEYEITQELKFNKNSYSPQRLSSPRHRGNSANRSAKKVDNTKIQLIQIRFDFYEQRRMELIKKVIKQRTRVMDEEKNGLWADPNATGLIEPEQFLTPLPEEMDSERGINAGMGSYSFQSPQPKGRQRTRTGRSISSRGGIQSTSPSRSKGKGKSSMIEKEMAQLEKIKQRQQKEIEAMMDAQKLQEEIRKKNELKKIKEQEREEKRKEMLAIKHAQQQEKKMQDEIRRQQAAEKEIMQQKMFQEKAEKKEAMMAEKAAREEAIRKEEAKKNEILKKQKQEQFERDTAAKLKAQQQEVEQRKIEMERRDKERQIYLEQQRIQRAQMNEEKRRMKEMKIKEAQQREEALLHEQRRKFEEKEILAEQQRQNFEMRRDQKKEANREIAQEKAKQIDRVRTQNEMMIEQQKAEFLKQQAIADERLRQLELKKQEDLQIRQQELQEKEQYRKQVQIQMEQQEAARKNEIQAKSEYKEIKMFETMDKKQNQQIIMKEHRNLQRQDRVKTVERIHRQNEYHRQQILQKIEADNKRSEALKKEKSFLLETRMNIKKKAEFQKSQINEAFEKMKLKGNIDLSIMDKLGISNSHDYKSSKNNGCLSLTKRDDRSLSYNQRTYSQNGDRYESKDRDGHLKAYSHVHLNNNKVPYGRNSKRSGVERNVMNKSMAIKKSGRPNFSAVGQVAMNLDGSRQDRLNKHHTQTLSADYNPQVPYNPIQAKSNIDNMRKHFNDELLQILEKEQRRENLREEQLHACNDPQEYALLEKQFGIERAKASQKIIDTSAKHEQLLMREMKKLGLM